MKCCIMTNRIECQTGNGDFIDAERDPSANLQLKKCDLIFDTGDFLRRRFCGTISPFGFKILRGQICRHWYLNY